jgi:hypothetical protein
MEPQIDEIGHLGGCRMKRLVFLVASLLLSQGMLQAQPISSPGPSATNAPVPPLLPAGARDITLPGGTALTVALTDKISSGTAKIGDTFGIKVSNDVSIDDYVVIAKDAGGQGEILAVEKAGSHGHAGSLGVRIAWVYAVSGEKVRLSSQRKTDEGENKSGVSSTMTILSWALLGPLGLFAHNWVKGHEMEIDGTRPLQAFVDDTVHVVSSKRSDANAGFAH